MTPNAATTTSPAQIDTQVMLEDLAAAVSDLTQAHQKLADLLAVAGSAASLDEVIIAIGEGNARLQAAERQRLAWLAMQSAKGSSARENSLQPNADQPPSHREMPQALAEVDRTEHTHHLARWLALKPLVTQLDEHNREHQMVVTRLGLFIQDRVNLLTNAADGSDTAIYAASGKTSSPASRRRSLGDA